MRNHQLRGRIGASTTGTREKQMSEQLDETLRRMEKAAEKILHDILNGTETRYEPDNNKGENK